MTAIAFKEKIGFDRAHGTARIEREILDGLQVPRGMDRVNQTPSLLGFIRPGEEGRFADERVDDESFVSLGQVIGEATLIGEFHVDQLRGD